MKCCKLCDKTPNDDDDMSKTIDSSSILNSLFPFGLDNLSTSTSIFMNSPHLKEMMMAAWLLKGYFQPAGPLIHHHASNSGPGKSGNITNLDSGNASESQTPTSASEEHSEQSGRSGSTSAPPQPPPPPPPAAHHMGYPRGYPSYQSGYYQGSYYPPPPQSAHYQPPPPPPPPPPPSFHQHYHHHQDLCYPPGYPPSAYPPPPGSYRRLLQPPPSYYSPELTYGSSGPSPSQDHGSQQMVVPGGASSSYSTPLDPYPHPYYPGYSPGPGPACYNNPPSSRNLAFIEQTYQSCPCPMQLCPKNVHIGPLTGECKRPGALPLPPVVLQLPQEPPGAAGPPSPARGSAGMPPQPSPITHSARPNWDGKTVKSISDNIKWEGSQTGQDLKPIKYKTDIVNCLDDEDQVKDLSINSRKYGIPESSGKSSKIVVPSNGWNHPGSQRKNEKKPPERCLTQGLLAISSQGFLPMLSKKQDLPLIAECIGEERKKIKYGGILMPPTIGVESLKIIENGIRKKNAFEESSMDLSPNRIKLNGTKIDEILVDNFEEGGDVGGGGGGSGKKKKRKAESVKSENVENKVRKVQENGSVKQKDENSCNHIARENEKNQKNLTFIKGKLLKDRNETVQNVMKPPCKKEKKKEESCRLEKAFKVISRRKSNQERTTGFVLSGDVQTKRKSKSCSPNRRSKSVERHHLTDKETKEESSRKKNQDFVKNCKGKGIFEHSKTTGAGTDTGTGTTTTTTTPGGKKKVGSNPSKNGRQLSILNKSVQQSKNKKTSKSDYRLAVVVVKKFSSKKSTVTTSPRTGITPKWSNGWSWDSESFNAKVYLTNDEPPVMRKCYTAMRHVEGDVIHPKDCILLKAGPRRIDLPFVAKVAALWENPDDGEMMVSLLWYYRPEHTDQGRQPSDQQDEIFASRHKDINSVACIEDKCFVLTYNEYCRYRKNVKRVEDGVLEKPLPVPSLEQPYFRCQRQPPCIMAPDMVFFCRRVYDFRQKRLLKNPT